ncbi:MAG: hypothetical protein L0Y56_10115 [Nitrospira sp.]|nr:hypothetical protein [Nitrospira sp.]
MPKDKTDSNNHDIPPVVFAVWDGKISGTYNTINSFVEANTDPAKVINGVAMRTIKDGQKFYLEIIWKGQELLIKVWDSGLGEPEKYLGAFNMTEISTLHSLAGK